MWVGAGVVECCWCVSVLVCGVREGPARAVRGGRHVRGAYRVFGDPVFFSFTLSVTLWCQSTDLMEYIKMDQVPFNFMKVEPSHDGPDYSRLTEPEPSPSSGRAVPTRMHLCWPPGPK